MLPVSLPLPPAGWYPDPDLPSCQRYFDGAVWTERRSRPPQLPPTPEQLRKRRSRRRLWVGIGLAVVAITALGSLSPGSSSTTQASDLGAQSVCESAVRNQLKAPSTAKFDLFPSTTHVGDTYTVVGYVDAENSFSAKIRSTYLCTTTFLHHGGDWHMDAVDVTP